MKKFLLVAILIFTTIMISGCYGGIVSDEEYLNLIAGVTATKENGETINYSLNILRDEIHFNNEIESANYCKLEIQKLKNCNVRGVCFFVRSSDDSTLTFTLFHNNQKTSSITKFCERNSSTEIDFFLENSISFVASDTIHIEIEQQGDNEDKTPFVFDTLIIFFEES